MLLFVTYQGHSLFSMDSSCWRSPYTASLPRAYLARMTMLTLRPYTVYQLVNDLQVPVWYEC